MTSSSTTEVRHGSRPKIIVVDDDEMTLAVISRTLRKYGCWVETSNRVHDGMAMLDSNTSVVLLDLKFPDFDGMECLRFIRTKQPDAEIIVLTGIHDVGLAVEAIQAGAFNYLTKPFDPAQLSATVIAAVEQWTLKRENRALRQSLQRDPTSNAVTDSSMISQAMTSQGSRATLAGQTLDAIEREAIIQTLEACNGNKAKSARMLGISEKSIYNKLKRFGIST